MPRASLAAAVLLLAVGTARAGGDHEMLAAEQELKIARDHLQAAEPAYEGHRHAAIEHIDRALQEIREAIQVSRGPRSRARAGAESAEEEAGALRGRRRLGPASMRDGERRPLPLLLGAVRPPGP